MIQSSIREWFFHIHYAGRSLVTMRRGVSLLKLYDEVRARHPGAKIAVITEREYSELAAKAVQPKQPGRVRNYEIDADAGCEYRKAEPM